MARKRKYAFACLLLAVLAVCAMMVRRQRVSAAIAAIETSGGSVIYASTFVADDYFLSWLPYGIYDPIQDVSLRKMQAEEVTAALPWIHKLPGVSRLDIDEPRGEAAIVGLEELNKAVDLRELRLTGVRDRDLHGLFGLTNVRDLSIAMSPEVTNVTFEQLGKLQTLSSLNLAQTPVVDKDLVAIGRLHNLEELYLMRTAVSDAGIKQLRHLSKLRVLNLTETRVTKECLSDIGSFPALEELHLWGTDIDDEQYEALHGLRNLKLLEVPYARCDTAGVPLFQSSFPGCEINAKFSMLPLVRIGP